MCFLGEKSCQERIIQGLSPAIVKRRDINVPRRRPRRRPGHEMVDQPVLRGVAQPAFAHAGDSTPNWSYLCQPLTLLAPSRRREHRREEWRPGRDQDRRRQQLRRQHPLPAAALRVLGVGQPHRRHQHLEQQHEQRQRRRGGQHHGLDQAAAAQRRRRVGAGRREREQKRQRQQRQPQDAEFARARREAGHAPALW